MGRQEGKTILIAEDDHAIIEVIKIILEDAGYITIGVSDGKSIVDIAMQQKPALILLDIWISGENGEEIAKKLKSTKNTRHIPIVMISANNETEQIAKKAGVKDFLQKPFNMEDLIAIVRKYTDKPQT